MNFREIAEARQSCRKYNAAREVEREKLTAILEAARIAPYMIKRHSEHRFFAFAFTKDFFNIE